jgi:hypothetical protein
MAKDSILYRIVVKVNMVLTKGFYVRIVFFCILAKKPNKLQLQTK